MRGTYNKWQESLHCNTVALGNLDLAFLMCPHVEVKGPNVIESDEDGLVGKVQNVANVGSVGGSVVASGCHEKVGRSERRVGRACRGKDGT